jgi:hypothetical protein
MRFELICLFHDDVDDAQELLQECWGAVPSERLNASAMLFRMMEMLEELDSDSDDDDDDDEDDDDDNDDDDDDAMSANPTVVEPVTPHEHAPVELRASTPVRAKTPLATERMASPVHSKDEAQELPALVTLRTLRTPGSPHTPGSPRTRETAGAIAQRKSLSLPVVTSVGKLQPLEWPESQAQTQTTAEQPANVIASPEAMLASLADMDDATSIETVLQTLATAAAASEASHADGHNSHHFARGRGWSTGSHGAALTLAGGLSPSSASSTNQTEQVDGNDGAAVPAVAVDSPVKPDIAAPTTPVAPATPDVNNNTNNNDDDDDDDLFALLSKSKAATASTLHGWTAADQLRRSLDVQQAEVAAAQAAGQSTDTDDPAFYSRKFECLLLCPKGMELFVAYSRVIYCEENAIFWLDADKLRTCEASEVAPLCQSLYAKYFSGAGRALNIEWATTQVIAAAFAAKDLSRNLFAPAQREIFNLMKFGTFQLFVKHDLFLSALKKYKRSTTSAGGVATPGAAAVNSKTPAKGKAPGTPTAAKAGSGTPADKEGASKHKTGRLFNLFGMFKSGSKAESPSAAQDLGSPDKAAEPTSATKKGKKTKASTTSSPQVATPQAAKKSEPETEIASPVHVLFTVLLSGLILSFFTYHILVWFRRRCIRACAIIMLKTAPT